MRYVNRAAAALSVSQAAYLYGSNFQATGAGPFAITAQGAYGPYPQAWAYIGAAAVVLTLPDLASYNVTHAYLFAIGNEGTAAASVDVQDAAAVSIVTLGIGDSALLAWDEALLTYHVLGVFSAPTSSGSPAWLAASRTVLNSNATLTFADGTVIIETNDGLGRTATLPVITLADVGRVLAVSQSLVVGSAGAVTVAAGAGQTIATSGALTTNRTGVFVAGQRSGGAFYWSRTI